MDLSIVISNVLMKYDFIYSAYIFGSYGKENFNSNSDIDIAILIKENISYMEVLKIEEELEEVLEYKVDLNSLRDLPEHIQLEIIIRNECIFTSDDIEQDKYLDELNVWYKTEYPFWLKMMTERGRA
ncbi:MAG: type VII toxin-antitoxin system MntA family adenylyltransferase antitoxin [Clostridium sp.]